MMNNWFYGSYGHWASPFWGGFGVGVLAPILLVLILWSFYWKARALWRAARNGDKAWFIVLILVQTLGLLDILYLYVFGKKSEPVAQ